MLTHENTLTLAKPYTAMKTFRYFFLVFILLVFGNVLFAKSPKNTKYKWDKYYKANFQAQQDFVDIFISNARKRTIPPRTNDWVIYLGQFEFVLNDENSLFLLLDFLSGNQEQMNPEEIILFKEKLASQILKYNYFEVRRIYLKREFHKIVLKILKRDFPEKDAKKIYISYFSK